MQKEELECCPVFDTSKWDGRTYNWDRKKFIMESIPTLFHIPFPPMIGMKAAKMDSLARKVDALSSEKTDTLLLFRDPTAFRSEMYLSVTKEVPKANNVSISGTFEAKVFDGFYNAIPTFINEMNRYLSSKGKVAKDYYVHYAYCPKCAQKFKHNYALLLAKV